MNALPVVEKAEAYLNVHLSHSGPGGMAKPPGPFVTLSRQSGAGGSAVARELVNQFTEHRGEHWTIYSANLIEEMLLSSGLPPRLAQYLPEDRIHEVEATIGEIIGLHPNLWSLIDKTNELIRRLARDGHAIFVGRGATFATAGIANGTHVRLVAPQKYRGMRTAHWLGLDHTAAIEHNARRDAARQRYVRSVFSADLADPAHYDIVLNTATVDAQRAAEIIGSVVRSHSGVMVA